MSGKHKLSTTRPKFLLQMMSDGDVDRLDDGNMRKVLHDTNTLCYVVYTVMMDADIQKEEIHGVDNDGEAIAVKLESKSRAKEVAELCSKETVRYGSEYYKVHVKVRDKYVVFTAECVSSDEDDDESEINEEE